MHKILLLLGLLRRRPKYGYELHQVIQAHGELYSDLKKANLYYLLDRLAKDGYLRVQVEPGTRGARGERLIYEITDQGRERFDELLREVLLTYEPVHTGVETAIIFLAQAAPSEAIALLIRRRQIVAERRAKVAAELDAMEDGGPMVQIASDHLLSLIDAELAWIDRSVTYLFSLEDAGKSHSHRRVAETD
ncbi:MAG TPA: PadR family transcriptional regulator [Ktedonobacteraceae bacterium]|jgi:DNA-binding PadR family transcriptional regulator|nr:PadR family transcriptional regulator [Ktedonobacteraceae bacterium]